MAKHMIHSLGSSKSFGLLTLKAKVLWPMIISEADDQGRFDAEPCSVKWSICQNVDDIGMDDIDGLLNEMVMQGMLFVYDDEDGVYGQVVHWWDYQQLSYARPSKYPPAEGWADRIHYRIGGDDDRWDNHNWEGKGGFGGWAEEAKDKGLPDPSDTLDEPIPSPSDKANKYNINKGKVKEIEGNININPSHDVDDASQNLLFQSNLSILSEMGVAEPTASECARYPHVNPQYLESLIEEMGTSAARGKKLGQGWLVTQIRNRRPPQWR